MFTSIQTLSFFLFVLIKLNIGAISAFLCLYFFILERGGLMDSCARTSFPCRRSCFHIQHLQPVR